MLDLEHLLCDNLLIARLRLPALPLAERVEAVLLGVQGALRRRAIVLGDVKLGGLALGALVPQPAPAPRLVSSAQSR